MNNFSEKTFCFGIFLTNSGYFQDTRAYNLFTPARVEHFDKTFFPDSRLIFMFFDDIPAGRLFCTARWTELFS